MISADTLAMMEPQANRAERHALHDRLVLDERRYAYARMADPYANLRSSLWAFEAELFDDPLEERERLPSGWLRCVCCGHEWQAAPAELEQARRADAAWMRQEGLA